MKKIILPMLLIAGFASQASAESLGRPCTNTAKDKWMSLEAIEKNVKDHGYVVVKSKMKDTCAEVYARDTDGKRIEFFIDPSTGNPVGTDWKPAKKG